MADSGINWVAEERSGHCAVLVGNHLYVWGGYVTYENNEVYLPNDEIWVYEIESGVWQRKPMKGELPRPMSGSCAACLNGIMYIFGGYDDLGYSNEEEEMFWGWNYDIHVFDPNLNIWYQPTTRGMPPRPRAAHACATLGNKGFLFGGRILETRINDLHCLNLDTWTWSGEITIKGVRPQGRSWHTLTPVTDDQLFLFGGLSAESQPLSDAWIYNVGAAEWRQLEHCPRNRPRLWHTACLGKEHEVMVFGGSKDDLLSYDSGHCNDVLIFQTQPYSLFRLCLDCIAKNSTVLQNQLPWLPHQLFSQVQKKITFWVSAGHQEK
ncbi:kelch domain-containing protein 1 isoform X7 [Chiloscyllium plagiosum]|uniref:kelch domain-containing protein 1 isoform X7 n=1 Tax=Chiloscyllium plagiosum TaxID=36176 RepID=UPI001CB7F02D|nr:kelch domain-containing protein 1 isoform X7 [Chiloscyllium plagiosum]